MRVTLLAGGLGGARLAPWLRPACQLTVIANVADDLELMGLRICPDVDAVLYSLAGIFDHERGYAVRGDSFSFLSMAERAGLPGWFAVGDRDLQTHVLRTALLSLGHGLAEVTARLAAVLGLAGPTRVLPATEQRLRTRVVTAHGELTFQEFFARDGVSRSLAGVRYEGLEDARPASGVVEAINGADLILIAESSPVASIMPILEMPGLRQALRSAGGLRVAISPIILAVPPRLPLDVLHWRARAALMRAAGLEHHPSEVARLYSGLIDAFVLDRRDMAGRPAGVEIVEVDLLDRSDEARRRLVELLVGLRNPGQFAGSPAR